MLYKITQKKSKGFTLSEVVITMAVLAIFLAVTVPLFTLQKGFTGTDKDAADCITKGTFDIASTACKAALSKCERNKGNTCNTLLNLVSSYSDTALKVLDKACENGGKQACGILINRCIDNSLNCSKCTNNTTICDAVNNNPDLSLNDYDIHKYLALAATDTSIGKETMYNLLKDKMDLGISNIYDRVITDCQADSASMACTLIGHKVYQFNDDDENDFIQMDPDYGTTFNNSKIQLTNDYWLVQYGGIDGDGMFSGREWVNNLVLAPDGAHFYVSGIAVFGYPYVMKVNISDGSVDWKFRYNSGGSYAIALSGSYIYIAGNYWEGAARGTDCIIAKIDASNGNIVWTKRYGGAKTDTPVSIAVSGSDIYVAGSQFSDSPDIAQSEMFVMKVNETDGTAVWKKRFGGVKWDAITGFKLYGNYLYLVGWDNSDTAFNNSDDCEDVYVAKLNTSDGTVVWQKHYGYQGGDFGYDLVVSGGYVYVSGVTSDSYGVPGWEVLAMKLNDANDSTGGTIVWKKRYGQYALNKEVGSKIYADGNYLYITGFDEYTGSNDVILMKVSQTDGTAVWKKRFGNTGDEKGQSLLVLGDYIYIAGYEDSDAAGGSYDIFLMKINKNMTSSNIGNWTTGPNGNGEDILNTRWGYNGGDAMAIDPTKWLASGVAITTPTTDADAMWTYGAAETTGGTGAAIAWTSTDIGASWTVNGAPITGWRPFHYYVMTSDINQITNIKAKIIKATIVQSDPLPANTNIKYLVSFDGRITWQMYDGSAWQPVTTINGLNDYTVATSGSTAGQIEAGLLNKTVTSDTASLDFAIYLLSSDNTATPYVDSIDIWYY